MVPSGFNLFGSLFEGIVDTRLLARAPSSASMNYRAENLVFTNKYIVAAIGTAIELIDKKTLNRRIVNAPAGESFVVYDSASTRIIAANAGVNPCRLYNEEMGVIATLPTPNGIRGIKVVEELDCFFVSAGQFANATYKIQKYRLSTGVLIAESAAVYGTTSGWWDTMDLDENYIYTKSQDGNTLNKFSITTLALIAKSASLEAFYGVTALGNYVYCSENSTQQLDKATLSVKQVILQTVYGRSKYEMYMSQTIENLPSTYGTSVYKSSPVLCAVDKDLIIKRKSGIYLAGVNSRRLKLDLTLTNEIPMLYYDYTFEEKYLSEAADLGGVIR